MTIPNVTSLNRRTLLQTLAGAAISTLVPPAARAVPGPAFRVCSDPFPSTPFCSQKPMTAPPSGSSEPIFDTFGNFWCLAAQSGQGARELLVLPAQSPTVWLPDHISALPNHPWRYVAADEFGYIWIVAETRCMRLDPHSPETGWIDFTPGILTGKSASGKITALCIAGSGALLVALSSGELVEIDRTSQTTVKRLQAPAAAERIVCDGDGALWLQCSHTNYILPPEAGAWQRTWELVDRLPAGDHDLSGDVLNGTFYMAGGQNAGWGYPARSHVFRKLWAITPSKSGWRTIATLDQPRFYNGTSVLDGKIWVIGGNTRDAVGNSVLLYSVKCFDPKTGAESDGPDLPIPIMNPVAQNIGDRIYVAGFAQVERGELPCQLLSIGNGETTWRREPDGPTYAVAIAGTAFAGDLYLAIPGKGLARFNPGSRSWSVIPYAMPARSAEIAAYDDEIWVMGGRDIERQDRTVIFRPNDGSWRRGPDLPRPLAWGAATCVGGRLLVVGGAAGRGYSNRTFMLRKPAVA